MRSEKLFGKTRGRGPAAAAFVDKIMNVAKVAVQRARL